MLKIAHPHRTIVKVKRVRVLKYVKNIYWKEKKTVLEYVYFLSSSLTYWQVDNRSVGYRTLNLFILEEQDPLPSRTTMFTSFVQ